jgi:eukaryotic-like serine/threonine-protein kinase
VVSPEFMSERFELRKRLGTGAFGVVYSAFDRVRHAHVALKLLRRVDATSIYQFKQEFRGLAGVTHPNLCVLYELGCDNEQWFFTMEWVDGVDLLTHVRRAAGIVEVRDKRHAAPAADRTQTGLYSSAPSHLPQTRDTGVSDLISAVRSSAGTTRRAPPLPAQALTALHRPLCGLVDGVAALHHAGHLHRDLKPSNVLTEATGRAVVLDFGIATQLGRRGGTHYGMAGTPAYMAPEQIAGDSLTPASDWYAVGVMLYELLAGTRPFTGPSEQVLRAKLEHDPRPLAEVATVPSEWSDLCMRLLDRDPSRRAGAPELTALLGGARPPALAVPDAQLAREQDQLIGREEHITELARAFAELKAGRGQVAWVTGLSGMGKSALCRRFADMVGAVEVGPEVAVLFGRCYEQEQVRFKALDAVLDALVELLLTWPSEAVAALLPADIAPLARLFPVLRRITAVAAATGEQPSATIDSSQLRQRAFAALRELLTRLGHGRPVIVVIDDLQWADRDSTTLLAELLRPPAPPPIMLIATLRSEDPATANLVARLNDSIESKNAADATAMAITQLAVDRLSLDQAMALARSLLAEPTTARAPAGDIERRCQQIARECGGNPFLIRELTLYARDPDVQSEHEVISLERVLQERFRALDAPMRRLLDTVAVAGGPIPRHAAEVAADLGNDAQTAVVALRNTHLVRISSGEHGDRIEPYHDRVREVAVSLLSDEARREQHLRLAQTLETLYLDDAEALAFHYEAAQERDKARHYAEQAGRESEEALAFERAAQHYRRALALGPDPSSGAKSLRHRLADCLAAVGRGPEAAEAFLQAAHGAEPETSLACRIQAANQLMISGHIGPGLAALGALLREVGAPMPRTPLRSLARLLWYRLRRRLRGLRWSYRPEALIPKPLLARLDVFDVAAVALGVIDTFRGADYQARRLLLALRAGEPRRVAQSLAMEGLYIATAGQRSSAKSRVLLDQTRALALHLKDPQVDGWVEFCDGLSHFFNGRFDDSVSALERSEQRFLQLPRHATWELNSARSALLASLRYAGRLREGYQRAEALLADARLRNDRYADVMGRRASHVFWLALGPPERARREIEGSTWSTPEKGFHIQHYAKMISDAEIAIYEGSTAGFVDEMIAGVRASRRALLFQIQLVRSAAYYTLARVLLVAADEGRESVRLRKAAAKLAARLQKENIGYVQVWGQLVAAGVTSGLGDRAETRTHLQRAITVADSCSARMEAACARYTLGQLLGGDEGDDLVAQAQQWFVQQTVAEPARLAHLVVPISGR